MRTLLIPGLGEDERIFDGLYPLIEGEKMVLNSWTILGDKPRGRTNAYELAHELINTYNITQNDILIGHSMGGLMAYCVKDIIGCRIVQIASYTDYSRIVVPVSSYRVIKAAVNHGLFFNDRMLWLIIKLQYENKPSKPVVTYAFNLLKTGNKNNVINQLTVALIPFDKKVMAEPDLRLHSKGDLIVRPPKQPYVEVPGDHFSLATHPVEVAKPINEFLARVNAGAALNA